MNEARAEDELARIMPCKEEEDGVNRRMAVLDKLLSLERT